MDEIIEIIVVFRDLQSAKADVSEARVKLDHVTDIACKLDGEFAAMVSGLSESQMRELNDRLDIEFGPGGSDV
jgi:hypothetical protein